MKTHDVKAFFDKVQKLYTMKDMGNPFMEETGDLFTLDTNIIAHPSVAEMVASQYDNGKTRFNEFLKGLDTDEYLKFYQPIKKNKTDFFQQKPFCTLSKKALTS
jgi:chlorite dismutase